MIEYTVGILGYPMFKRDVIEFKETTLSDIIFI